MSSFVVLYFYQGEPGESSDCPNCFPLSKAGGTKATFGQFLDRFPASARRGRMHFRFKADENGCGYVWLDVTDRQTTLPMSNTGVITCKILLLDQTTSLRRYSRLKVKKNREQGLEGMTDFLKSKESQAYSIPKGINSLHTGRKNGDSGAGSGGSRPSRYVDADGDYCDDDDNFPSQPPAPKRSSSVPSSGQQKQSNLSSSSSGAVDNLLDDDYAFGSSSAAPVARSVSDSSRAPGGTTKQNMPATPNKQSQPAPGPGPGPGPTPTRPAPAGGTNGSSNGPPLAVAPPAPKEPAMSREELAARREAHVAENVENALREKQDRDERLRKDAADLDDARSKHDRNLTNWQTVNKEKRNVRTLLTTMHTVLWPGNKWKAIGLGDVIEPKQVKLQYRKAMLVVHPDKLSSESAEIQFIAKRIFEGINEAYQEFLKKEEV